MPEHKLNPKWKRAFWLAFKVYAGLCTLLMTAYIPFIVWVNFYDKGSNSPEEMSFMSYYGRYMAKEYPKRGDFFCSMAITLRDYARTTNVLKADLFSYLGKPDLIAGNMEAGELIYFYRPSWDTNRLALFATLKAGKLVEVGVNDAGTNDLSGFKPYAMDEPPNKSVPPSQGPR